METSFYKEIIGKLESLIRKDNIFYLLKGSLFSAVIIICIVLIFSIIESIGNFNSLIRSVLFISFIIISIGTLFYFVFKPILRYLKLLPSKNYNYYAKRIGSFHPEFKDELLNALQLIKIEPANYYSTALIGAAFERIYWKTKDVNFNSIVDFGELKKSFYRFLTSLVIAVLVFLLIPGISSGANRIINFTKDFIPPAEFYFEIIPGNTEITKGNSLDIFIKVKGKNLSKIFLAEKEDEQTNYTEHELKADSNGVFIYRINNIRSSFSYYAFAQSIKSDDFRIEVIDNPIIKSFNLKIIPPSYTKLPVITQKDNGSFSAIVGSRVELEVNSNKEINESWIEFSDSSIKNLNTNFDKANGFISVTKNSDFTINVKDTLGNKNLQPVVYSIEAIQDQYPTLQLEYPQSNINLPNDNRIPLLIRISDDFGFSKLLINYRLSSSRYEPVQKEFSQLEILFDKNNKNQMIDHIWNLTNLSPAVDDVFSFFIEVMDNDVISGPKSAKSQLINVRVPSLDEILASADDDQENIQAELQETLKEAQELKEDLQKIDAELKQERNELTWEEKEKIEQALDKFESLQDKMENISEQLQKVQNELQQNNLLSKETLEKYMQLQELMSEMTSEDMKKAFEQMQQMLQQMNRNMTQDALKNMQFDEERFQKSIERTMNLLKRIQVEQKIDELMERSEITKEKQDDVSKETNQSDLSEKNNRENLSNKQDEITKELEKMSETMKELSEKMNEMQDVPKDELQKLMEEFEKQKNQQLSEQSSQNLMQNQKQNAQNKQQQLSQNMQQMKEMVQQMKNAMMQQNQMQNFTDMMRILDNLLSLSQQQEELKNQTQNLEPNSSQLSSYSQKQNDLQKNLRKLLEQMADLSQKTFAVTPEMGKALGLASKNMEESLRNMQNRNPNQSGLFQQNAMGNMNEAAMLMKSSIESMMQGGSGQGGMMSLMQQLQQMAGQQMSLNNLTQMLQQMQQGGFTGEQQAQLQRLAQQQEMIRKSLEQLNNEARESGESKKIPANLENIVKQMQEVVSDLQTEKLNDELVQKQERILSRLLDAQRSINERDFEKERRSETGINVVRESPGDMNLSSQQGMNKLKDELDRSVREGYQKDYEELIKKYFEKLQEEDINN